jgi:uncharacterized protein with HEPN domain
MKRSDANDRVRILHIWEEVCKVKKFSENMSFKDFESDEKTQDACIRSLEIIGEASNYLTNDF